LHITGKTGCQNVNNNQIQNDDSEWKKQIKRLKFWMIFKLGELFFKLSLLTKCSTEIEYLMGLELYAQNAILQLLIFFFWKKISFSSSKIIESFFSN
jgi:hypothetical protein